MPNAKSVTTTVVKRSAKPQRKAPRQQKVKIEVQAKRPRAPAANKKLSPFGSTGKSEIAQACESIALPGDAPAVRYSDEWASSPTAIANPWAQVAPGWSLTADVGDVPATDLTAFLFRDPLRAAVIWDANDSDQTYTYEVYALEDAGQLANVFDVFTPQDGAVQPFKDLPMIQWVATSSYQPHGPILHCGHDDGHNYVWIDKGGNIDVTFNTDTGSNPAAGGITCNLVQWYPGGGDDQYSLSTHTVAYTGFASGSAIIHFDSISEAGYYRVTMGSSLTQAAGSWNTLKASATCGGASGVHRHLTIPGIDANSAAVRDIRITGAAIRYTNQAPPLYREGQAVTVQVSEGEDWQDIDNGSISTMASLQGACLKSIEEGIYSFLKPEDAGSFEFKECYHNGISLGYDLEPKNGFLCVYLSVAAATGRDGYWKLAFSVEYETDDVWRGSNVPHVSDTRWHKALTMIRDMPQHYTNPMHWGQILIRIAQGLAVAGAVIAPIALPGVGLAVSGALGAAVGGMSLMESMIYDGKESRQQKEMKKLLKESSSHYAKHPPGPGKAYDLHFM